MASPQTDDGYTRVANELAEAIFRFPFSGQEFRVVFWVLRNIYGWKGRKQTLPISVRSLAKEISMPPATASWVMRGLGVRGVIMRLESGSLRLNKNYEEWLTRGARQLRLTSSPSARRKAAIEDVAARPQPKKHYQDAGTFKPPTLEQVQEYCLSRKSQVDPAKFWNHYEANGWVTGRNRAPVTNWKSSVCYWERTTYAALGPKTYSGKLCPLCEASSLSNPNAVVCDKCGPTCRACGEQTANLKIVSRRDGTKTAQCKNGCPREQTPLTRSALPEATKKMNAERTAKFMQDHKRRKGE